MVYMDRNLGPVPWLERQGRTKAGTAACMAGAPVPALPLSVARMLESNTYLMFVALG